MKRSRNFLRLVSKPLRVFFSSRSFRIFISFALWSLVLTYPLVLHLSSHIPLGSEPVGTVPLFNLWTLQWNIDQLMQGYSDYWNAPIFAPTQGTFAFSETQPLTALLAAPVWLGLRSPALGYNFIVLFSLTANGWFAYCLLRQWSISVPVAFLAGLLMQSLPFIAQEMGVLQLLALFGVLWTLLFLTRFLHQAHHHAVTWSTAIGLALGITTTFLTCGYYGLFSLIFLPPAFGFQLRFTDFTAGTVTKLGLSMLLALALTGPMVWPQQQILAEAGYSRPLQTIQVNSARVSDYTKFLDDNLWYSQFLGWHSAAGQRLLPGIALIILAALGLAGAHQRRVKLYLLTAATLALTLSLGLNLTLGDWQPYSLLQALFPGYRHLRSPFRFAAMVQLHLALLAGFGLHNLQQWFTRRSLVVAGATAIALFEMLTLPVPLQSVPMPQNNVPWQQWLRQQSESPIVVMIPFAASTQVESYEQTVRWMLSARYHQAQMVNGYSGFFPPYHAELRQTLHQFPTVESLNKLNALGVELAIVHHKLAEAPTGRAMRKFSTPVFEDLTHQVTIYKLPD